MSVELDTAAKAILLEMGDRRLLNDVDEDLHEEIGSALATAAVVAIVRAHAAKWRDARIAELEASFAAATRRIEVLESLRPHWAQGHSSDSIAAQTATATLSKLWNMLGANDQTEAVEKLSALHSQLAVATTRLEKFEEALRLTDAERRLFFISFQIETYGFINRADICTAFNVSVPQASKDIARWLAAYPEAVIYNKSRKRYETRTFLASNSTPENAR